MNAQQIHSLTLPIETMTADAPLVINVGVPVWADRPEGQMRTVTYVNVALLPKDLQDRVALAVSMIQRP